MIDVTLVRKVRNRAYAYSALLLVSAAALFTAIVIHDDSQFVKFSAFFGTLGVIVFWLISGSEMESLKRVRAGEAPYGE